MKLLNSFLKIGILILVVSQMSCRKDFSAALSNGNLTFSSDTLYLDTVFNNLSTTTKVLTIYNSSKNDLIIPKIKLENPNSKYRINVDGFSGTEINDVLILEKDSLFVFVEATVANADTDAEMLYKDKLLFDPEGNEQKVELITLVKDAKFFFPSTGTDYELSETNFTNTKPYVIYGNAIVAKNSSLTIDAGTVIHFSENASLTIDEGASLQINGTLNDSVVFKGDKLSYVFNNVPGQWNGIKFNPTATGAINYSKILNASTAIEVDTNNNTLEINNTEIYNAANYGILTKEANINAKNLVIGQAGKSNLKLIGGNYNFTHCTFANYWNKGFRVSPNISLSNYYLDDDFEQTEAPINSLNFINSILVGSRTNEVEFDKSENEAAFVFKFTNCLINLTDGDDFYDTSNSSIYTNNLFNESADFRNTAINDLRIGLDSKVINLADGTNALLVPLDIIGTDRTIAPDIGAYQHIDFKTLEPQEDE